MPRLTIRWLVLTLVGLALFTVTLLSTTGSSIPTRAALAAYDKKIPVPHFGNSISKSFLNPFKQSSHRPPHNEKDQFAGSSWLSDWKWLKTPFSSAVTVDDDRALLPPLKERQPIYCYYDATIKKTAEEKDAESALLLTWRRAWWSQGFRPIILSAAEAMNNPTYDMLQRLDMEPEVKESTMRWLAWEAMDGGILAHYTLLPTVPREDPLLKYLRRGEYPRLTRWKDLDDALFTGQKDQIRAAIQQVLEPSTAKALKSFISGVSESEFYLDKNAMPLASYSAAILEKRYSKVADSIKKDRADGLRKLNKLITAHLHVSWQNRFPEGIEVLKPHPEHMSTMVGAALKLGKELASCTESPMPATCPPNAPKCTPCVAMSPMTVSTPTSFQNTSKVFSIGTVPHPWTLTLLRNMRDSFNVSWLRAETDRDAWLVTVTQRFLSTGVSTNRRLVRLKEAIAGEHATAHSLWIAAEKDLPADMTWYFGFDIPERALDDGQSGSPVPGSKDKPKTNKQEMVPIVSEADRAVEQPLIEKAKQIVMSPKSTDSTKLRASLEAWNMADTEIWKFVRAFQSRRHLEREQWEKLEAKYSGGAGTEKGRSAWNRWQDQKAKEPNPTKDVKMPSKDETKPAGAKDGKKAKKGKDE